MINKLFIPVPRGYRRLKAGERLMTGDRLYNPRLRQWFYALDYEIGKFNDFYVAACRKIRES